MRNARWVLAAAAALAGCTNFSTPTATTVEGSVDGVTLRQPVATYNIEHHGAPIGDWVSIVIADVSSGVPADGVCGSKNLTVESTGPAGLKVGVFNADGVRVPSMTILVDEETVSHERTILDEAYVVFDTVQGKPSIGSSAATADYVYAAGGIVTLIKADDATGGTATGTYDLTMSTGESLTGGFVAKRCEAFPQMGCGCSSAASGAAVLLSILALPALRMRRRRSSTRA